MTAQISTILSPFSRNTDNTTFVAAVNAFFLALPTFITEANALSSEVNAESLAAAASQVAAAASEAVATAAAAAVASASGYMRRSSDTLTVGTGAKALTGMTGHSIVNGDQVALIDATNANRMMFGQASSVTTSTLTVTVTGTNFSGSGSGSNWIVLSRWFAGLLAGIGADLWGGSSSAVGLTPAAMTAALAPVALTPGATVTLDLSQGRRFTLAPTTSFTLANPINCHPGDRFSIFSTNGAGSIVLATAGAWKRQNGLFVLDAANGHTNKIFGEIEAVDGSNVATLLTYGGIRNPA